MHTTELLAAILSGFLPLETLPPERFTMNSGDIIRQRKRPRSRVRRQTELKDESKQLRVSR